MRIELDESRKAVLNEKLRLLMLHLHDKPEVTITYFEPDTKKQGGRYRTVKERVKKVDTYERRLVLEDKSCIYFEQITKLELKDK